MAHTSNSRTVYKYPVTLDDAFALQLPRGAQLLTVQVQRGEPVLWALVDPGAPDETRTFRLAGTGHRIDDADLLTYVGTFQLHGGALVFHLFAYPVGS